MRKSHKKAFERARKIKAAVLLVAGVIFSAQAVAPSGGSIPAGTYASLAADGSIVVPPVAFASLPTAAAGNKGNLLFDSTNSVLRVSDGFSGWDPQMTSANQSFWGVKTWNSNAVFAGGINSSVTASPFTMTSATSIASGESGFELNTTNSMGASQGVVLFRSAGVTKAYVLGNGNVVALNTLVSGATSGYGLDLSSGGKIALGYTDSTGTPGAATINKSSGRSAVAASASSVQITNNQITSTSTVFLQKMSADTTCTDLRVGTVTTGSFTVNCIGSAATATTSFMWVALSN